MIRIRRIIQQTGTTPLYNIGIVSNLTGLPVWTVRWIEKHEFIIPHRTQGNQRLFSDEDLELLREVRELMEERVNLQGIRVILRMRLEYKNTPKSARHPGRRRRTMDNRGDSL